jgi:hypothetical protein
MLRLPTGRCLVLLLAWFATTIFPFAPCSAQEKAVQSKSGQRLAELVAPLGERETMVVVRLHAAKLDLQAAADWVIELAGATGDERRVMERDLAEPKELLKAFREAGGEEVILLVGPKTKPGPEPVEIAAVAVASEGKGADLDGFLRSLLRGQLETRREGNVVYVASDERLERFEKGAKPSAEIAKAFDIVGDAQVQVAIVPTADTRRVAREMLPRLPDELGGFSGADLDRWVQWTAIALDLPPKPRLRLLVQASSEDAARSLEKVGQRLVDAARETPEVQREFPQFDKILERFMPEVKGDRLIIAVGEKPGEIQEIRDLLEEPLQRARDAAKRAQAMNNLKQIGLAMHNYHDTYRGFPPRASHKDDKPLLSWRVHILPYVEQQPLYNQFKLDEPWDSEHNRKLIEKMPQFYVSPRVSDVKEGHTTYVVPVGEKAIFAGKEGLKIQAITDGTSNTILALEAAAEHAVIWTKPDDLQFDPKSPLTGIHFDDAGQMLALFADGSVRAIKRDTAEKNLPPLVTASGGEVIEDR